MRLAITLLALASLLAIPGAGSAQEQPPPPPRPSAEAPPRAAPAPRDLPPSPRAEAPPRGAEVRPAYPARPYSPYPRVGPRPARPYAYYPPPRHHHGWGWSAGWGWGWYPLYPYRPVPAPPPDQPIEGQPPPEAPREPERIYTRLSLYGAGRSDGYMGGVSFGLEGRYMGFDIDVAALAREPVTGPLHSSESDSATWATAHLTWTLVSDRSIRLRAETGASVLALPDSPFVADRPWRGKTLLGPDVGISGQLGLLGPMGIEGYARVTPFPVRVADTFVGLALHAGPLGVSGGWRWVDVAGDEKDAPRLMFRGPQVGLVLRF